MMNQQSPNGLPPHRLVLKRNIPIILIRNINPSIGLCNGVRLIVRDLFQHFNTCTDFGWTKERRICNNSSHSNECNRTNTKYNENNYQSELRLHSQSTSLKDNLWKGLECSCHSQCLLMDSFMWDYSRVKDPKNLHIMALHSIHEGERRTKNVVLKQALKN